MDKQQRRKKEDLDLLQELDRLGELKFKQDELTDIQKLTNEVISLRMLISNEIHKSNRLGDYLSEYQIMCYNLRDNIK